MNFLLRLWFVVMTPLVAAALYLLYMMQAPAPIPKNNDIENSID